ncbi:MAG: hypothetical protein HY646_10950, partial [Acidobacteria bacterium]|nr:hypothetical protein [Acidobacteriota bacterium]
NNINTIVRHLRIEAQWHLDCIENGAAMPLEVSLELQQSIDAVPMDFEKNWKELQDLFVQFIERLSSLTVEKLKQQSMIAYKAFGRATPHMLCFHQAIHLAGHMGQISSIRNLYRKTRGEPALFFPDNPTFPK